MFSFLFKSSKDENYAEEINEIFKKLKNLYEFDSITKERKELLKNLIEENGYLPYPFIRAQEELTPAEVLYGIELKAEQNKVFENGEFKFENDKISPAQRAGFTNGDWIKREQHNVKLINLAGLGNGNQTKEPGKLIDWLRQLLILPSGLPEKGVLGTTVYLIPFHPREFGCAYLPVSTEVSPNLEDQKIKEKLSLDAKQQVQLFVKLSQLCGHCVIYDVLPQTGRFSKIVLAKPNIARWFDIDALVLKIRMEVDKAAEELKKEFNEEDVEIVRDIYKDSLKKGCSSLSEHYQIIYDKMDELLLPRKKEISDKMMSKQEQDRIHKIIKAIVADINELKAKQNVAEEDITKQGETIKTLIEEGLWPAPGGAWCSSGTPVFDRMSEAGDYPIFKHFDYKGDDVTHFANLDCQTPYYFVNLENGEFNEPVVQVYIDYLKQLQTDYNFDGFRVDHIDHIVDTVSEKDGVPISYRAPRKVLGRANKELKKQVPHFATLAEYMLWDKFYKEYHEDMDFDILWGNDIIAQHSKKPETIMDDNHELADYNISENPSNGNLSILKIYNNQDGEFRAIDQYPGQLGQEGALFKWFKYKFLPGGKNAQRSVMYIDGDESFTKTGIEGAIGSEVSMMREKNLSFFNKFNAINKFALENELTREGEAQIIEQTEDGFVSWMVSKDPLKTALLIVANYQSPTEKVCENNDMFIKYGQSVFDKKVTLPCDYSIVSEYVYKEQDNKCCFEEIKFEKPEFEISFGELKPAEFKIYKLLK